MLEEEELGRLTGKCWIVRWVRVPAGELSWVCVWAELHPEVVWDWTAMQIKRGVTTWEKSCYLFSDAGRIPARHCTLFLALRHTWEWKHLKSLPCGFYLLARKCSSFKPKQWHLNRPVRRKVCVFGLFCFCNDRITRQKTDLRISTWPDVVPAS